MSLEQVFLNLITNAIDAHEGKPSGSIHITTGFNKAGNEVVATVSDTGSGIPDKDLERVFDPFFTTKPVGKGQGLASQFRIASSGRWEEAFQCEAKRAKVLNSQSSYLVRPSKMKFWRTQERTTSMRKPRLLLVDDDIPFTRNLVWLLSRSGYEVSAVNDGQSALRIVEEQEFDVIILDRKMPGIDGIATLKELKKKRPQIEVIILTGAASVDSALDGVELGAYDYTVKANTVERSGRKNHSSF